MRRTSAVAAPGAFASGAFALAAFALAAFVPAAFALTACTINPSTPDAGGSHTCADCIQAAACCQAVLASEGNTTSQCSSSESICSSLPLDQQAEYVFDCDSYLMNAPKDAAACQQ